MVYPTGTGISAFPVSGRDHVRGLNLRHLTLLEYGDYECPYSRQAYPVVESILKRLNNSIRFAYRHFPLIQIHSRAQAVSRAAEAAALQGSFWTMHEKLYTYQSLEKPSLRRYASIIGLNLQRFDQGPASLTVYNHVKEDYQSGVQSGVKGTPSFFVNGILFRGSWDFESLLSEIKKEMKP